MKRRSRPLSVNKFKSLLLGAPDGQRCVNVGFLLHLERAVREMRREQARSMHHPSSADRTPK